MNDAIIVALISGVCVGVPSVMATIISNNKTTALMNYKIEQLEKKVEKHNNVVERTYGLEEDVRVLKEKMTIYHHE